MLANNLLTDLEAPGRLRSIAVGITGSSFTPLAIPQLISEYFVLILEKTGQIADPFEQSFILMVTHRRWMSGMKRISRNGNRSDHRFVPLNLLCEFFA